MEDKEDETEIFPKPQELLDAEEEAKHEAIKLSAFVTGTMGNRNGRDFVWHLLDKCGVYKSPFDADTNKMVRNVGWLEAGQYIIQLISLECPREYEMMLAEHRYKEKEE